MPSKCSAVELRPFALLLLKNENWNLPSPPLAIFLSGSESVKLKRPSGEIPEQIKNKPWETFQSGFASHNKSLKCTSSY